MQLTQQITEDNIATVFNTIQESSACHLKYSMALKKALESPENETLLQKFTECLHILLIQDHKGGNIYLNRVINFLTTFCNCLKVKNENSEFTDHQILTHIITFLLKYSRYAKDSCRYWSCKVIRNIIENTDDLSEELFEKIKDSLLESLRDTKSAIRLEALSALYRFQDPSDKNDLVIEHLHDMLNIDFNTSVRRLCVEKIALTKYVLPSLIKRTRDVDVNVRLTTFKRLTSIPTHLSIAERRLILQCGFLDSSDKIKNYVNNELLEEWLRIYENDSLLLMKSVRLDACKEDIKKTIFLVEHILNALFKTRSAQEVASKIKLNEDKLMNYETLNWESVLYYRIAIQHLRKSEYFDQVLNNILPELVVFCKYIKEFVEYKKRNEEIDFLLYYFTLEQFFVITAGYDVSDEASRQSLNSLLHFMLQNTELETDVAIVIMQNLEKTIPNLNNRSLFISEIIANISSGEDAIDYEKVHKQELERQLQISQIKSDIMSLNDSEQQCILEKRFLEADEIKTEIRNKEELLKSLVTFQANPEITERKTDIPTVVRCLTVAESLLRSPSVQKMNPVIATICSEYIQKNLVHDDITVKTQAFRCYALCCIIDLKSAKYGIHIFSAPIFSGHLIDDCSIDILIISIKAVVDLLSLYGLSLVEKGDDEDLSDSGREDERKVFIGGTSLADLIAGLADLLDHENIEVQEVTTKGICILLINNRITSSSLLSRIIIKWANPSTDNDKIKQFIGHTLNLIPTQTDCLTYFSDVVITTIRTLVYAPSSSPLQEINVEYIAKFMLNLCQMSPEGSDIHTDIAFKICSHMNDKPRTKIINVFSKVLLLLNISKNEQSLKDLVQMCDQLRDKISNNQVSKNIIKFNAKLEEILASIVA